MKLYEFDYSLPGELIAQDPLEARDGSRLMVLDRETGETEAALFRDLPRYLDCEDHLVINDSKVIPARLHGRKSTGAAIEILLLRKGQGPGEWEALLKPGKRVKEGTMIHFGPENPGEARIAGKKSAKVWVLEFTTADDFDTFLRLNGSAPLPPYIKREGAGKTVSDLERYQTVYAHVPGSVAAPTAGLHFTDRLLSELGMKGVGITKITLHVGYGTFLPIESEDIEGHMMEEEFFEITSESAEKINAAKRVIAVGTTSTRVLESASDDSGHLKAASGSTRLFIYPGYRFKRVQGLITNFHLPKSSLFLLASAFAGKENLMRAYERAIREKFRFYSYGDCMMIR